MVTVNFNKKKLLMVDVCVARVNIYSNVQPRYSVFYNINTEDKTKYINEENAKLTS